MMRRMLAIPAVVTVGAGLILAAGIGTQAAAAPAVGPLMVRLARTMPPDDPKPKPRPKWAAPVLETGMAPVARRDPPDPPKPPKKPKKFAPSFVLISRTRPPDDPKPRPKPKYPAPFEVEA